MGRREDIIEQLKKDYELLSEYENELRTEIDPALKARWKARIQSLKQQIKEREEELKTFSSYVPNKNTGDINNSSKEQKTSSVSMTFNAPVYGVAGNVRGNQNINTPEQTQSLSQEETQQAEKQLSEIPVTGDAASEVGADYTKLRNFLQRREFGKADLETVRKILWVAKRENYGWLDVKDIENFPSLDLQTINQLWLTASKGKFGFSVQKQILTDLGGELRQNYIENFKSFLQEVEWAENQILFDERSSKGHLPVGVYVKFSGSGEIYRKWSEKMIKIVKTEKWIIRVDKLKREIEDIVRANEEKRENQGETRANLFNVNEIVFFLINLLFLLMGIALIAWFVYYTLTASGDEYWMGLRFRDVYWWTIVGVFFAGFLWQFLIFFLRDVLLGGERYIGSLQARKRAYIEFLSREEL